MKKLDQLTFTRFVAAFSVVLFHGGAGLPLFNFFPLVPLLTSGQTAVSYFYVLSGFVMALAYYRPGKKFDFRTYWIARFSRIYPVYLLSFVVTCLYYLDIMAKVKADKIWANLLLYQAWIPRYALSFNLAAWSLSVEAFFYILFPFLALAVMRIPVKRLIWISLGFWIVSQVVHSILYIQLMPDGRILLGYFPLFHLNSFVLGVAGGAWYLTEASRHPVNQSTNRWLMILSLALASAALIGREFLPAFFGTFTLDVGLLAPFFLLFVLTLALDSTRISQALSHPWLVTLGDASYALYILHVPVRWLYERVLALTGSTMSFEVMYYTYVPAVILLSVLVFLRLERPVRDWLRVNIRKLPLILLDVLLIAVATWASFSLRLGSDKTDFVNTFAYALRVGLAVYFGSLILFRVYTSTGKNVSWMSLPLAILIGAGALTSLVYLAWTEGWVEAFPRTILLLDMFLTFVFLFASRFLLRRWKPELA